MNNEDVKVTGERLIVGLSNKRNEEDHIARYEYAEQFVKGKRVLDLACGSGFGSAMVSDAGAVSVDGVDIAPEAIDYAKKNFARENVSFHQGSADSLSFADKSFDVIVSFETIEHLPDEIRAKYLDEMHRVLTDEGLLLLSTPNKAILSPWTKKPGNKFHILEYSRSILGKELADHKFEVTEWRGQRLVHKVYAIKPIRVLEVIRCRLMGTTSKRYFEANGPDVLDIPSSHTPRYFVTQVKKKQ